MAKMSENELVSLVGQAEQDAVIYNGEFRQLNESYLSTYLGNPYGDELADQSQVISNDVQDVVESDMPSLVRVFGNNENIMQFEPTSSRRLDKKEAEEKSAYINWIINNQKNSYKIKVDWIKDALIQKYGVVRYDYVERETVDEQEYHGLTDEELTELVIDLEEEAREQETSLTIIEQNQENGENYIKFRIKTVKRGFELVNIPTENFLISRNAKSKDEAELVGDKTLMTRSSLIEMGYDEKLVRSLPTATRETSGSTGSKGDRFGKTRAGTLPNIRYQDQGGEDHGSDVNHWASQEVEVSNLYVDIDYDGDGIAEKRHILKSGNVILENEPFPIAPYAMFSAVTMPHNAVGRSRAELTQQTQRVKTVLFRQILDNIYRVNNGRTVVNDEETNIDDLLTVRPNGIVRTSGDPRMAVAQLETPYIGDKALQVVQYVDSTRAQSTGAYLANQGLDSDQLYNETATRFLGVQEQGEAKIELIARNMAETGFRELYSGLAWMVQRFQDAPKEIMVLGRPMTVDPRKWRFDQPIACKVGLAAGNDTNTIQNFSGMLQIDEQLRARGSLLTDEKKTYNKIKEMLNAMGVANVSDYYNDPDMPDELILAQNERLMTALEQAQLQLQSMRNPLAEAETINAKKDLIEAQGKAQLEIAKLTENARQFNERLAEDKRQYNGDLAVDLTKIEAETGKDVDGSVI